MSWAARTEQRKDAGSAQSGEPLGATKDATCKSQTCRARERSAIHADRRRRRFAASAPPPDANHHPPAARRARIRNQSSRRKSGRNRARTCDLPRVKRTLSQLSYAPWEGEG